MTDSEIAISLRHKLMGYIVSQSIVAVTELGVPARLADGPLDVRKLAADVGADADSLGRFLRALAGEGLFTEVEPGVYALTDMGQLLRDDVPGSLRSFATLMTAEAYEAWSMPEFSLRTGKAAFDERLGKPMFAWLADHPEAAAKFNDGQAGLVTRRMAPLFELDWTGTRTVVDVGGGNGTLLTELLRRNPHLEGVLFDLPEVVGDAPGNDRIRRVGGDFLAGVPGGADTYVLAQILHDWNDEQAATILRRCREALPAGGRLLIVEQILEDNDRPDPAKLLDLHMLVLLGGRERTLPEWRALLAAADFSIAAITPGPRSFLIEARPLDV